MLLNYVKIAWRNAWKNKLWAIINVTSLGIGIAAVLLIFLFIEDERSFDDQHLKGQQIFRLTEIQSFPGSNTQKVAISAPGMGPALMSDYPEVKSFTRYMGYDRLLYKRDGTALIIDMSVVVDTAFLEIFDFELISGNATSALVEPYSIVITQETARKFFGSDDPMGEVLQKGEDDYEVTGVLKNIPENSHLQFDILISISTSIKKYPEFNQNFWGSYLVTYLLMSAETDIVMLERKMPEFLLRHMPWSGSNPNSHTVNDLYKLIFQPLAEVHLGSMDIGQDYHNQRKFNGTYLNVFTLVALLILLIAAVNFMNLITARTSQRWKEVGVRKTIGAKKGQLFWQFSIESTLLGLFAFGFGVLLAFACAPVLNILLDRTLSMQYFLAHPIAMVVAFCATILLGFLASLYPSYYLASFNAVHILRGGKVEDQKSIFRSSLVILQFGLAIGMIICTLIVVQQMYYIENKDIGLNKEHMLLVRLNQDANDVFEPLKAELKASSKVKGVTASRQRLANNLNLQGFKLRTDSVRILVPRHLVVDFDYLDVYEIDLVKGRGFSQHRPLDDGYSFIINETFANNLDLDDPIGVTCGWIMYPDDSLGTIIGVVKDFNYNSLHHAVDNIFLWVNTAWGYTEMSVKISGDNIESSIADVENIWNSFVPNWPFQYSFLDDHFEELYRSDRHMKSFITIMAILAIFIACMGLFGLAAITVGGKVKEIGIRKVLGASIGQIMVRLSKNFALLVIIAFLLFSPVTYLIMKKWLNNFADRIDISPVLFILGFLLAFTIAILTISYHTLRAARLNPVHSLRDD